jgi:FkbM family methyltransferase
MKIMFDIGCNNGKDSDYYVHNNYQVFAFEPTPKLCDDLRSRFKNNCNFFLIEKAISNKEGKMKFNIVDYPHRGCSSLLNFIPDTTLFWDNYVNATVIESIHIDVIRLDSFIKMLDIKTIDYFHCDIQGLDLSALESLGTYISIVKEGQIEVANKRNVLYENSNNYIEDVINFLEKNNFIIKNITSNDIYNNESNLQFINKNLI